MYNDMWVIKKLATTWLYVVLFIVSVIFISSCASTARITLESAYVDTMMRSGAPKEAIKTGSLSDTQIVILTHAFNKYDQFRAKWKANFKTGSLLYAGTLDDQLLADYQELKLQYKAVKRVVLANWNDYDAVTRMQLAEYMRHAESLDTAVIEFMADKDRDQAISHALEIFATVLQIGLTMK